VGGKDTNGARVGADSTALPISGLWCRSQYDSESRIDRDSADRPYPVGPGSNHRGQAGRHAGGPAGTLVSSFHDRCRCPLGRFRGYHYGARGSCSVIEVVNNTIWFIQVDADCRKGRRRPDGSNQWQLHLLRCKEKFVLFLKVGTMYFSTLYIVIPIVLVAAFILVTATIKILREYERAVVFTLGRFQKVKGPGLVLLLPCRPLGGY
jgi:hypothetical protein